MILSVILGLLIWYFGSTKYSSFFSRQSPYLLSFVIFSEIFVISVISVLNFDLSLIFSFPLLLTRDIDPFGPWEYIRLSFFDFVIRTEVTGLFFRSGLSELYRYFTPTICLFLLLFNSLSTFSVILLYSFFSPPSTD